LIKDNEHGGGNADTLNKFDKEAALDKLWLGCV